MLKCTLCSLIAVNMRTGTLTRPNEIAPLQSARGMRGRLPGLRRLNLRLGRLEGDAHILVGSSLLDPRALAQRILVPERQGLLADHREAPRPELARMHGVDLGREQGHHRAEVHPREQA